MKEILLTQGKIALVDDEDYELVNQRKWYANKGWNTYYGKSGKFMLHRVIMKITDSKIFIDHINGNGLDNRKENLRICNHSQNVINSGKRPGKSSKYKGVVYHKKQKRWHSSIQLNGKRKHIGSFLTEEDAAKAYENVAIQMHKEFARLK